jgi:hypothetical protein
MMSTARHSPKGGTARTAVAIDVLRVWGTSPTTGPIIVQRANWGAIVSATVPATATGSAGNQASAVVFPTKAA